MAKIKSIMKYLKREENRYLYIGDEPCFLDIPRFFEDRGFLEFGSDRIYFLGICRIRIGSDSGVMILPAILSSSPVDITSNDEYIVLEYNKGNGFIENTNIIQTTINVYQIFTTFVTLGKKIDFVEYKDLVKIFDNMETLKGINLKARRSCFELLYGEISRDENDLKKRYRLSDMKSKYQLISMRNVSYGPKSVTSKLLGSYFNDALVSTLLVENEDNHDAGTIESYLKS